MKKLFLFMAAVGMVLTASAQSTDKQMATLQHGDVTSVFYGIDAFINAYNAAADSLDVITLSSGNFSSGIVISKSISIYGAGCEDDTVTGMKRTTINSDLRMLATNTVNGDDETITDGLRPNGCHFEGLYVEGDISYAPENYNTPLQNLTIARCSMKRFYIRSSRLIDCTVRQSVIRNQVYNQWTNATNLLFSNCYVEGEMSNNGYRPESTVCFDHCLFKYAGGEATTYTNCIMRYTPRSEAIAKRCIFIDFSFTNTSSEGNWGNTPAATVWATEGEDGSYAETKDFALKDPSLYIGTDGTEVGLHGGAYPWNKIPSIPRITECIIDTENAANGTIKVSIKAEAQTKE